MAKIFEDYKKETIEMVNEMSDEDAKLMYEAIIGIGIDNLTEENLSEYFKNKDNK